MNKRISIAILIILTGFLFNSCKNGGGVKEGELVYKITYVQSEDENPLIALLPKTITIKFKDDNTAAFIEGFFGTFNLKIITNQDTKKNYTILRILDKKFINEAPVDSLSAAYENIDILQVIERPSDTATFAGIVSYQVDVVCNKMSDSIISVYCTKDIDIDNPNSNSPFYQVNGVLTKFQARVAGIDMIFELEDFNKIEIDDNEFLPPDDYKKISGQELKDILKSFQQ